MKLNLKKLRKLNKISQQEMADSMKITRSSYTQIELGNRKLSFEEAVLFCNKVKCDLIDLINDKGFKTKDEKIKEIVDLALALKNSRESYFVAYITDAIKNLCDG
jgi:transcriptional regulator with XRE-family HTH domain